MFDFIKRILKTEAILFTNAIKAVGMLLIAWGLPVTGVDVENFSQLILSALSFGVMALAFFEREQVFSQETVEKIVEEAE